eukprot:CAMPEP_0118668544 /NCGR_PEP_ID=MMETSP0785-20121206/20405_1 /TAXON_ID=91992 /ORGANISM="Bolidomonas pacifica, Strain CCMP 1866" /LENGTH=70 /DNA_ID=CAMNT_0006563129 /DNA_START=351 /DNA_END=563 /DNA_ORIENTATION=+
MALNFVLSFTPTHNTAVQARIMTTERGFAGTPVPMSKAVSQSGTSVEHEVSMNFAKYSAQDLAITAAETP